MVRFAHGPLMEQTGESGLAALPTSPASIWWDGKEPSLEALNAPHREGLSGLMGIEFIELGADWIKARMPVDERTWQPFKRLHGGASVALAETVGTVGAIATLDPTQLVAVGMEINANHVRPAYSGWVYATARPEAIGRSTQVWSIRIEDEQGKLVCVSRFTVAVIPIRRQGPGAKP
jgi:1,4-dihydroxy-2-naphthoyl-CoA hydrolase